MPPSRWPVGTLRNSAVGLSADQLRMVNVIEAAFSGAGYSLATTAAAVVNAYAESRLNPLAVGDSGRSIGLFQLNTVAGAGIGYTRDQLVNPERNASVLLAKERRSLAKVEAEAAAGAGVASLAGSFSRLVERPKDTVGAALARAALTARLFPLGLTASSPSPATAVTVPGASSPEGGGRWWLIAGLTVLLGIGGLAYARAYARPV